MDSAGVPELAATNAKMDMILIRSVGGRSAWDRSWRRPAGVTVKNCKVIGAVRVVGMVAEADLRSSSYRAEHVRRMRLIAPTRITFDRLTVTGRHRIPVYIGAGVTGSQLIDSELNGRSDATAIYVDAESSRTLIKKNSIHAVTPRELVALDSSDHNVIIDNRLSALNHGGIYLYRNCGENGLVRHTTPSWNTIVNNVFYYNKYSPSPYSVRPSVFIGSRNGSPGYCGDDNGHPLGSSVSNLDYARENVVMQNQIYKLRVGLMIREGRSTDSPNFIKYNTTVTQPIARLAGCYVPNGYYKDFLADREGIRVFRRHDGTRYIARRRVCHDGRLE